MTEGRVDGDPGPGWALPGATQLPIDPVLDDLAAMAARLCQAPMALVSLLDGDRQWFAARVGVDRQEVPGDISFCSHALAGAELMVIQDTQADARFAANPLVTGDPFVRFYAGAPMVGSDGRALGTLCVLDLVPRALTPEQQRDLTVLAELTLRQLELHRRTQTLAAEIETRAAAQEALRRNQRVLDGVLGHTDVLVYAKDLTGRYILANRAVESALGADRGLLGMLDTEVFSPELAEAYRSHDAVILVKRDHQVFDEELIHADGTAHLYRASKFPLVDDDDQVYAIAGVSTDVTELMAVRTAHQEAEERWRVLVEHSPVAVAVIGPDGTFVYANPAAMVLFEVDFAEQIIGRSASDFVLAEESAELTARYDPVARGGPATVGLRWHMVKPSGVLLTVEVNAASITYLGLPALQVELRDVTVRAAAEEALRDSEHRFHALFNGSPVPMALSDGRGLWVDANAAFGVLLGVDPAEMIGHPAQDFTHPDDHILVAQSEQGQKNSPDGVHRMEMRFLRPDGSMRWAWLTITPTPGPAGQIWTLAIAQDVTARKEAETALRESESDLAAIAAVARCVQDGEDPRPVVVQSALVLAGASMAALLEPVGNGLVVTAVAGGDRLGLRIPLDGRSMAAQVWRTGEAVFLSKAMESPDVDVTLLQMHGITSAMWQPVIVHGTVQALLTVSWREQIVDPGDRAVRSVRVIADEAGVSLNAKRLMTELERSALTDPLTGSLNRRAWDIELSAILDQTRLTGGSLTIALIDLDHFKWFNDTRGHGAGDAVLQAFAASARRTLRAGDVFARWGGEEFIVALPQTSREQAIGILDRLRQGLPEGSTCSVGHTMWKSGENISSCIARADSALYDAKQAGRNRVTAR